MPTWEKETTHPAWSKCKNHSIQLSGISVAASPPGCGHSITLRVNCAFCGCPGEIDVNLLHEDVEWKIYPNQVEPNHERS